ncbi:uncharacterized protein LOC125947782 [Dermacentor silvarum]|uniref:uncharacterized protein LOC125947782 n=1 Tax=Dermacentor silvarum TaxID=543639 RepID=UPI002100A57F|nr:uncharacterized protein LOC125947782 [Dermacentor silvarum]
MEVDTGSPVCVISRELYMRHRNHWPTLKPSRVKLSCYAGPLPVLGDLTLRVGFKDVLVDCSLTVLDCEGPSLCGRDLLTLLDKAGAPVLHVTPVCGATKTSEMDPCKVKAIFTDYQDIFTTELGLMKGPPASLHLKDGAIPKFCREFTLVTDHQPLVGLLRPDRQTPTMVAARIQRWALYLGGYKYKLQYVPGKQLLNSDALSRLPQQATGDGGEGEPPEYVLALESLDEGVVSTRELKDLTAVDSTLRKVQHYVLRGWPPSKTNVQPDLAPYYERRLELSLAHDLVYWDNRVVIPSDARERFLQLLHETHQGSSAMKAVARSLFWWPGLDRDIEQRPNDESDDCTLPPDSIVYVRNYGQGEKWIPGRVKSATGARMVTVETPNAIVKRHVDQVRRRSDSSPRWTLVKVFSSMMVLGMFGSPLGARDRSPDPQRLESGEVTPVHQRASRRLRGDPPEFGPLPTATATRTMSSTDATTMTSQATSPEVVVYPPRMPEMFHGDPYEDVEDWLEHFERVADVNGWNPALETSPRVLRVGGFSKDMNSSVSFSTKLAIDMEEPKEPDYTALRVLDADVTVPPRSSVLVRVRNQAYC